MLSERGDIVDALFTMRYHKCMNKTSLSNYVKIRREEYLWLKKLQKNFETFWNYLRHLRDIEEARQDVKKGRTIPQEKLFKRMRL